MPPPFSMSGDSETEEWWFDVRPKGVGKRRPRPISDQAAHPTQRQPDGTETFETRVAIAQSTWRAEWENEASTEGIRTFGCRPDARKRNSPLPSFRVQKRQKEPFASKLTPDIWARWTFCETPAGLRWPPELPKMSGEIRTSANAQFLEIKVPNHRHRSSEKKPDQTLKKGGTKSTDSAKFSMAEGGMGRRPG